MVETENSRPDGVASSNSEQATAATAPKDEFMVALVENFNTAINAKDSAWSEATILVLYNMRLDLLKHTSLRESVSTTNIVIYAIKAIQTFHSLIAMGLISHLAAGGHAKNIDTAYKNDILNILWWHIQHCSHTRAAIDATSQLKLRVGEDEEGLLNIQSLSTIVQSMRFHYTHTHANFQEWGCSILKYVVCQDHGCKSIYRQSLIFCKPPGNRNSHYSHGES